MSIVTDNQSFQIERACERLIFAYTRALDSGDSGGAADFFAEHGSLARPMAPDQIIQGREAIRASLLTRPKTLLTKHLTTNVLIEVEGPMSASGISYLTMIAAMPAAGAAAPHLSPGPLYFGEFKDRFVLEG